VTSRLAILTAASWFALVSLMAPVASAGTTPVAATTDSPAVADVVSGVETTYKGVESIRADFVQVTRSAALGGEQKQKGRMVLKRPRKMRWEFQGNDASLFVTDGATMWVYSPAQNQVVVTREVGVNNDGAVALLGGLDQLDELFQVTLLENESGPEKRTHVLELVPRKPTAAFKKLRITVDRKKYTLERLVWTDAFDNQVDLSFSQVKLNPVVSDTEFVFQVPSGANVIDSGAL
jgi:outer membrane lipoprotein carrier protein